MPPKAKLPPAPIDRPLSRAYLRQFTGWSTAYPPGVSDPTSLREMENVMIDRKGSVSIRPGMRYLSYAPGSENSISYEIVGSHETFFLNDGTKALLVAVRLDGAEPGVGFKVLRYEEATPSGFAWYDLTDAGIDFTIPQGEAALTLSENTTYVRYLQIDNKIFALGNAGDSIRLFHVGEQKTAETIIAIERPNWTVTDKLKVVHPDALWVTAGTTEIVRTNLAEDPSFEFSTNFADSEWTAFGNIDCDIVTTDGPRSGANHLLLETLDSFNTVKGVICGGWTVQSDKDYEFSSAMKLANMVTRWRMDYTLEWFKSTGALLRTDTIRVGPNNNVDGLTDTYEDLSSGILRSPVGAAELRVWITFPTWVPSGSKTYVDDIRLEQTSDSGGAYFDGSTADTVDIDYQWAGVANASKSYAYSSVTDPSTIPTAEAPTADTLISSGANTYSFGYFYTFFNEIGESCVSQVTVIKASRPWNQWKWERPNALGEPDPTDPTDDPRDAADQLVVYMPEAVYDEALEQEAKGWNLYMFTWSDQDSVPVEAALLAQKRFDVDTTYGRDGWLRHTPAQETVGYSSTLPIESLRYNYSSPSHAGQGLVASDRIILVNDPESPAVIRWSSNNQGDYTNFTANRGGGYKTLTSGNLFIPAAVKLWQNPQSADTLTILCSGVDGYSTAYYMAPAQIAQQSEAVNIMGFEETTATPGTVSPFGCEVMNNALYHPLDPSLMKSTASNYNINHRTVTDMIENMWVNLTSKINIVSAQLDLRLYLLVNNPAGAALEAGCLGNEIWVYDSMAKETGHWSRWLIQGCSLRTVEVGGRVFMSVVRPDGVYYLDPDYALDDFVSVKGDPVESRSIPWKLMTNTQGANRAHDAPCRLQQANLTVGNFRGALRYGVRGWDIHGKPVLKAKIIRDQGPADALPFDLEDYLTVQREMKEWFFFAESLVEDDVVVHSEGQLSLVQYRYAPISVNVGYEYGSIETFEYGRAENLDAQRTTDSGVPQPMIDTRRP